MATGDRNDIISRLKSTLPNWFGDLTLAPLIGAVLTALATTQSFVYSLIVYATMQLRIMTATDGWLDMIAADFFGPTFFRHSGQSDQSFRVAIIANLLRPRGTRAAVIAILTQLTGRAPLLVEFNRPTDTGAYGGPYLGYSTAGAWGTLNSMPMQAMVIAYRPYSLATAPLGYYPTDAEIFAAIESVRPAAYQLWVALSN